MKPPYETLHEQGPKPCSPHSGLVQPARSSQRREILSPRSWHCRPGVAALSVRCQWIAFVNLYGFAFVGWQF